jgi:hypothetical protein
MAADLNAMIDTLGRKHPNRDVRGMVLAELARFDGARVTGFVPILVEKAIRDQLRTGRTGTGPRIDVRDPVPEPETESVG